MGLGGLEGGVADWGGWGGEKGGDVRGCEDVEDGGRSG